MLVCGKSMSRKFRKLKIQEEVWQGFFLLKLLCLASLFLCSLLCASLS